MFLNDIPIMFQSVMQKHVMLSMTEVELAVFVNCIQDTMCVCCVVMLIGLQVKLPVIGELDNCEV